MKLSYNSNNTFRSLLLRTKSQARNTSLNIRKREKQEASFRTLTYLFDGEHKDTLKSLLEWIEDPTVSNETRKARRKGYELFRKFKSPKPGEHARQIRKRYGYSQEEWANLLQVSRPSISLLESRHDPYTPAWRWLLEYIDKYGISLLQEFKVSHL